MRQRWQHWRKKIKTVGLGTVLRRAGFDLAHPLRQRLPGRPVGPASSDVTLDVIIPVIEKDLPILPHTLAALRQNLRHPVGEMLLVAPDSAAMRRVCAAEGCRLVPETEALPVQPAEVSYRVDGRDRSGWVWQQLVKLNADRLGTRPHVLVVDADTLLLQPHCFMRGSQSLLLFSDEFHYPYFECYQRLFGRGPIVPLSFVSHYMLLHAEQLQALRAGLEARHGRVWYEAILAQLDRRARSSFSEYETYGNFVTARAPGSVWREYARNGAVGRSRAGELPALADELRGRFRSLSLHSYLA